MRDEGAQRLFPHDPNHSPLKAKRKRKKLSKVNEDHEEAEFPLQPPPLRKREEES